MARGTIMKGHTGSGSRSTSILKCGADTRKISGSADPPAPVGEVTAPAGGGGGGEPKKAWSSSSSGSSGSTSARVVYELKIDQGRDDGDYDEDETVNSRNSCQGKWKQEEESRTRWCGKRHCLPQASSE